MDKRKYSNKNIIKVRKQIEFGINSLNQKETNEDLFWEIIDPKIQMDGGKINIVKIQQKETGNKSFLKIIQRGKFSNRKKQLIEQLKKIEKLNKKIAPIDAYNVKMQEETQELIFSIVTSKDITPEYEQLEKLSNKYKKNREILTKILYKISKVEAEFMVNGFIHGDLNSRNIFVKIIEPKDDKKDLKVKVKLIDFDNIDKFEFDCLLKLHNEKDYSKNLKEITEKLVEESEKLNRSTFLNSKYFKFKDINENKDEKKNKKKFIYEQKIRYEAFETEIKEIIDKLERNQHIAAQENPSTEQTL